MFRTLTSSLRRPKWKPFPNTSLADFPKSLYVGGAIPSEKEITGNATEIKRNQAITISAGTPCEIFTLWNILLTLDFKGLSGWGKTINLPNMFYFCWPLKLGKVESDNDKYFQFLCVDRKLSKERPPLPSFPALELSGASSCTISWSRAPSPPPVLVSAALIGRDLFGRWLRTNEKTSL